MSDAGQASSSTPSFFEAVGVWAKIGVLSFGGPAGQIALMHRVLVDERKWLDEKRYLSALNFCMLLPGPEAMQLATYAGWRLHGVAGGLAAGLLFVLPGAILMCGLALAYAVFGKSPAAEALFIGVKAAVLAIVIEALLRVARRALKDQADWLVAAAAFVAIFFFSVPFPLIVVFAALVGFWRGLDSTKTGSSRPVEVIADVPLAGTVRTIGIWLTIWLLPLFAVASLAGSEHVLTKLAWFFSKLAVVTFGGAYAVLAYMAQEVVQGYGWLTPGEMLDALGLAETTPGPLILVTEFVGALAGFRSSFETPFLMGILAAIVTLWATFAPCFLWIFAGAPYIERLNAEPKLRSALQSVTAAVVGVILNLTVWFALHVLFARLNEQRLGPLRVLVPDVTSLDTLAFVLSLLAVVLIFVLQRGILTTLALCAALAFVWRLFV